MGGLPAGAPERPTTPGTFPAVHDMPPPRSDAVLTDDEQAKLEKDLSALRTRQGKVAGTDPAPAAAATKPKAGAKPVSAKPVAGKPAGSDTPSE